jgi:hypothetical protein
MNSPVVTRGHLVEARDVVKSFGKTEATPSEGALSNVLLDSFGLGSARTINQSPTRQAPRTPTIWPV